MCRSGMTFLVVVTLCVFLELEVLWLAAQAQTTRVQEAVGRNVATPTCRTGQKTNLTSCPGLVLAGGPSLNRSEVLNLSGTVA